MSCPTCDYTMEGIGHHEFHRYFYCHRCGTLLEEHRLDDAGASPEWQQLSVSVPKLVNRCREFVKFMKWCEEGSTLWSDTCEMAKKIGIFECINIPGDRP